MNRKVHKSETQVKWAGQQLQSSNFANAFVQETPRKEVTILFRTRKLKIHDLRMLSQGLNVYVWLHAVPRWLDS